MADINLGSTIDTITTNKHRYNVVKDMTLGVVFNEKRTGGNAKIFPNNITANIIPSTISLYLNIDSNLDLILMRTKGGVTVEGAIGLVSAGVPFKFDFPISSEGESINFRTNVTMLTTYTIRYASAVEAIKYQ